MESKTPKMIGLNVNLTEQESRVLSKFLKKTISALEHVIVEHEEGKIKAETALKLHELRKSRDEDDEDVDPVRDLFMRLSGEDPIEAAREFLKHYDKCVQEHNDGIIVMKLILENIKSQVKQ